MAAQTVLSIGNFDGVHIGHAALIRRARALAGAGRVIALAFDPHPFTKLRPSAVPPRLTTFERREELLRSMGADEVVRLLPDDLMLSRSSADFASWLVASFSPTAIVEGSDFHYGKARTGNVRTLAEFGAACPEAQRFSVEVVPPIEVALDDHMIVTASSSITRWLVARGRVRDAATVLGRSFEVEGVITKGDQRGRTIGFPTANVLQGSSAVLVPADGVYAAIATLPDGTECAAAVNVGTRPTFDGVERRTEALLLDDAGGELRSLPIGEYGWRLRLAFVAWLRDQVRFSTVDGLRSQLTRDVFQAGNAVAAARRQALERSGQGVVA